MKTSEIYLSSIKAVLIAELAPEVTVTDDVALYVSEIIHKLFDARNTELKYGDESSDKEHLEMDGGNQ